MNLETIQHFPDELQLLVHLTQAKIKEENEKSIMAMIEKLSSWDKLFQLARHHLLVLPLKRNLDTFREQLPDEFCAKIDQLGMLLVNKYLTHTVELVKISEELARQNIPFVNLKGPVLSAQLYGDITYRQYRDIDMLTSHSRVEAFEQVLFNMGYKRHSPDFEPTPRQKRFLHGRVNEFIYQHSENHTLVEVHWRLFNQKSSMYQYTNYFLSNHQEYNLQDYTFPVLAKTDNFIYLCIHGANHAWINLHWLRDMAAFTYQMTEQDFDEVFKQAKNFGLEKIVLQSLVLANFLYEGLLPVHVQKLITSHNIIRLIDFPVERLKKEGLKGTSSPSKIRSSIYRARLKNGLAYKINCFKLFSTHYDDWKHVKLPDTLFFLYFPLRSIIWLYKKLIKKRGA